MFAQMKDIFAYKCDCCPANTNQSKAVQGAAKLVASYRRAHDVAQALEIHLTYCT